MGKELSEQLAAMLDESFGGALEEVIFFAEGEARHLVGDGFVGGGEEVRGGDGDDARLGDEVMAEGFIFCKAPCAGVSDEKVSSFGGVGRELGFGEGIKEKIAFLLIEGDQFVVVAVAFAGLEDIGDSDLEGGCDTKGNPLVGHLEGVCEVGRCDDPTDLPACDAEALAARADGEGSFPHPRQGGDGEVLVVIEVEAIIDFIGEDEQIVLDAEGCDLLEFFAGKALSCRIIGGIEDEHLGAGGDGGAEGVDIEHPAAVFLWAHGDVTRLAASHQDGSGVGIIKGFDQEDFIVLIDKGLDTSVDGFGGTDGDGDLAQGVDLAPPFTARLVGEGLAERGNAACGAVLLEGAFHCGASGLAHKGGGRKIGETLAEIDGLVLVRKLRPNSKDGIAEALNSSGCAGVSLFHTS